MIGKKIGGRVARRTRPPSPFFLFSVTSIMRYGDLRQRLMTTRWAMTLIAKDEHNDMDCINSDVIMIFGFHFFHLTIHSCDWYLLNYIDNDDCDGNDLILHISMLFLSFSHLILPCELWCLDIGMLLCSSIGLIYMINQILN